MDPINKINSLINTFIRKGRVRLLPWLIETSTFIVILLLITFLLMDVVFDQNPFIKYTIFLLFVIFFVKNDIRNYWQIRGLQHMYNEIKYVNNITEALRSTMKLENLLDMILENLTKELNYERAFIFLMEKEREKSFLKGEMGVGVLNDVLKQQVFELDEASGILARTAIERKSFIIKDAKNDHRCEQKLVELMNLKEFATLPLIARDAVLGVLIVVADGYTKKEITSEDITLLDIFANQSAIAIQNARFYEKIEQLSVMDGLTSLYNHRYFHDVLRTEFHKAKEKKQNISLVYFDLDDFKYYNDTYGHIIGDSILKDIGHIIRTIIDDTAIPARYGGEEFAVILPNYSKEKAFEIAESIRDTVEKYNFDYKKEHPEKNLTVSLGVSSFPEDVKTYRDLIKIADDRLYTAKNSGKNRTFQK